LREEIAFGDQAELGENVVEAFAGGRHCAQSALQAMRIDQPLVDQPTAEYLWEFGSTRGDVGAINICWRECHVLAIPGFAQPAERRSRQMLWSSMRGLSAAASLISNDSGMICGPAAEKRAAQVHCT